MLYTIPNIAFSFQRKHTCFLTLSVVYPCPWVVVVVPIAGWKSFLPPFFIDKDESDNEKDPKSNALYMSVFMSLNNELLKRDG